MLHRCVSTNRCCPKAREEEYGAAPDGPDAPHAYGNPYLQEGLLQVYGNPYLQEDMSQHPITHFSILEGGADFPAGALSLMYDPTDKSLEECATEIPDEVADDWFQDVDDLISISRVLSPSRMAMPATQSSSASLGMLLRGGLQSPGGSRRGASRGGVTSGGVTHGNSMLEAAAGGAATASRGTSRGAESRPPDASPASAGATAGQGLPRRLQRAPGSPGAPVAAPQLAAAAQPAPWAPSARTLEGFTPGRPPRAAPPEAPPPDPAEVQPRSMSRSVREAKTACSSDVGAASIQAILHCVAQAQELPAQQRPNSQKWAERLRTYDVDKRARGI